MFLKHRTLSLILLIFFLLITFFQTNVLADQKIEQLPTIKMENGTTSISGTMVDQTKEETWTELYSKYKVVIVGSVGIAILVAFLYLIRAVIQLATANGNPQERKKAFKSIGVVLAGIVGLGSITFLVGLVFNLL